MADQVPFRGLVQFAIGGGWGTETPESGSEPVAVIRGTDFADVKLGRSAGVPLRFETSTRLERRRLRAGDILLEVSGGSPRSGQTTGRSLLITESILGLFEVPVIPASFCRLVRVDGNLIEPRYGYYQLQDMYLSGRAGHYENQSTGISNFQFEYFLDAETVRLPPLAEQHAIAEVLGALDDKIELNEHMNATLDEMAQALFKSWFVDFDPVRAKAEGGQPSHMDAATAALFPDSFEDSALGLIPAGWRVGTVDEAIDVNPRRALKKGTEATYVDMAALPTAGPEVESWRLRPFTSGSRFQRGDTLLARITPCLENGKTAFVDFLEPGEIGWGSTEFIVLRPKAPIPESFAYTLCRDDAFREHAITNMTGSSGRQRVPADAIAGYRIVIPTAAVVEAFGNLLQPWFGLMTANAEESRTLAELRDTLLPKLISGEIRVGEAEREVGAAV